MNLNEYKINCVNPCSFKRDTQWSTDHYTGLQVERSGFKTGPGQCVVLLDRKTSLTQCLSLPKYKWFNEMLGGNLAMD